MRPFLALAVLVAFAREAASESGWGQWGSWTVTGECSALCGRGYQERVRERTCQSGDGCSGPAEQPGSAPCNEQPCTDICRNTLYLPAADISPSHFYFCATGAGESCDARAVLNECSDNKLWYQKGHRCVRAIPVDGGWTDWTEDRRSSCSTTCGYGTQQVDFSRSCTKPAPQNEGADCPGQSQMVLQEQCPVTSCPLNAAPTVKMTLGWCLCVGVILVGLV